MFTLLLLSMVIVAQEGGRVEPSKSVSRFVRIARIDGRVQILRYGVNEWEDAVVNMILAEGDRIYTDKNTYTELQFDNGTVVRLNEATEVEIVDLTRVPDSGDEITSIYVSKGNIKVNVPRYYRAGRAFNVETPHGLVTIEEESSTRININDKTEIITYDGRANLVNDKGKVSLLGGERTFMRKDESPAHPEEFKKLKADKFDEWSIEKGEGNGVSRKYLPAEIIIGVDELDYYGRWIYVHPYGWVWRPKVYFGWRPYFHGHWVFTHCWGWFWVSYEPWGWIPYRYGRWAYCWPYGWVWIPGPVWAPCWVVWCYDSYWVWWTPMGPCDGPWFYCSAHFRFGGRWVGVSKNEFKNYKYTYHPHKDYRRFKPYKYAGEPSKNMEWKKTTPDIRPTYATHSFGNKKVIVPSHANRTLPRNNELLPNVVPNNRGRITPEGKKYHIPSPSKEEEISPFIPQNRKFDEKRTHKRIEPDFDIPKGKRVDFSESKYKKWVEENEEDMVSPVNYRRYYIHKKTDIKPQRLNPSHPSYKSINDIPLPRFRVRKK